MLVQVIAAGVGGTAMPMWAGALDTKQLWSLAHYVRSLALKRATPEGKAMQAHLLAQPIPQGSPQ
jgi:mono/diheme cytochrome c family protein